MGREYSLGGKHQNDYVLHDYFRTTNFQTSRTEQGHTRVPSISFHFDIILS